MTTLTQELAPSLQSLVDARLDNIDRALLSGNVSRSERRQVVSAVEEQIFELLDRLDTAEPTREQVLQILAALDPPEAYASPLQSLASESAQTRRSGQRLSLSERPMERDSPGKRLNVLSIISLVLACIAVFAGMTWVYLDMIGLLFLSVFMIAALTCGIVATCQICASQGKQTGLWMSILGLCGAALSLFTAFASFFVFADL